MIEESNIVSEVTFIEGSNGTSSVSGQYVSEEGRGKSYRGRGVPGLTREAREVTIEKGRKRIQTLATSLKLANRYVEAAQRLYSLALQHNFVQGRRTLHVIAACLYLVCRRERTPRILCEL